MPEASRNRVVVAIEVDHTRVDCIGVDRTKVAIAPEVDHTRAAVASTGVTAGIRAKATQVLWPFVRLSTSLLASSALLHFLDKPQSPIVHKSNYLQ